ncbi:hypothetical protein EV383_3352 [Pseudonocardia sediminis]|uniref:Uncharacterized protein n=1 Tax=Pseudonocardia sediminis TaxID=1397368 RepID=A0A4Q7UWQ0_PSEST|nr:hypothetical protein [Pseudonocardia sediminis]RZT86457.1 hypothetical protein EV383_3352 [Pseudonocardia sediminis]
MADTETAEPDAVPDTPVTGTAAPGTPGAEPAQPVACSRCSTATTLLHIVGNCADCLADMGLNHPEQFTEFKAQVLAKYGSGGA